MSLKSSVERKGKIVTQIVGFTSGNKKTWRGVKTDTIEEGSFCKFDTLDGRSVNVQTRNVDWFEVIPEVIHTNAIVSD